MAGEMSAEEATKTTEAPAVMTVAGEEVKIEVPQTREVNMEDRDPNHMLEYVQIKFADLIAEADPEVYSFERVWETSYKAFTVTKMWCYKITSLILGVPCAVLWGIYFACLAFCTGWCCMPCIKSEEIELLCIKKIWRVFIEAFCHPFCDAWGRCFGGIAVKLRKEP